MIRKNNNNSESINRDSVLTTFAKKIIDIHSKTLKNDPQVIKHIETILEDLDTIMRAHKEFHDVKVKAIALVKAIAKDVAMIKTILKLKTADVTGIEIHFKKNTKRGSITLKSYLAKLAVVNSLSPFYKHYKDSNIENTVEAESIYFLQETLPYVAENLNNIMGIKPDKRPSSKQYRIISDLYKLIGYNIPDSNPVEYLRLYYKRST